MIIGQVLNGAIRTTFLRVTLPFSAAIQVLRHGPRGVTGFAAATRRLGAAISAYVLFGILATGRAINHAVHVVGSTIASAYGGLISASIRVLQGIKNKTLPMSRALRRSMAWSGRMIPVAITLAAKLAAASYAFAHRSTGRVYRRLVGFVSARYRAFIFRSGPTYMTLSMEDGYARLLVLKGNRVIAWRSGLIAEAPVARTLVEGAEAGPAETALAPSFNPLKTLLADLPYRSKRVVADLPLHLPLLRHIPLPDVKGRLLRDIVNAEVLDSVPFEQDEVDIQWRVEQGEDIREASVTAIPRDRMDDQIRLLRRSQLTPSAVYSKAASLAVAVARPDVFILHMTVAQAAVILVREGITRIVHRLDLPRDINEQAEVIAMGVGQVAGYHRSQRPNDDVGDLPIVVTGEIDKVRDLVGILSTVLGRPLHPFEPALECPEGFAYTEFASNIGLYLVSKSNRSTKLISAQNVLPERHRPRPLPVAPTAVFTGLLVLGFLAFNLAGWVSSVADESGPLSAKLDIREGQARDFRLAMARQNVVNQRITEADVKALGLIDNLESFGQEMDTLLSRISGITGSAVLSGVTLTRLVPIPEGFSVSGSANSYSDVLGYAAMMRDSPVFEDATVLQVADASGPMLGFTVVVTVPRPNLEDGSQN